MLLEPCGPSSTRVPSLFSFAVGSLLASLVTRFSTAEHDAGHSVEFLRVVAPLTSLFWSLPLAPPGITFSVGGGGGAFWFAAAARWSVEA